MKLPKIGETVLVRQEFNKKSSYCVARRTKRHRMILDSWNPDNITIAYFMDVTGYWIWNVKEWWPLPKPGTGRGLTRARHK